MIFLVYLKSKNERERMDNGLEDKWEGGTFFFRNFDGPKYFVA